MMNQAKCTTCGAGLTIKKGDKTCVCEYCQSTNIVENALALAKVDVDVSEDIKKLRDNLRTFVQQNSIDEILRVSQKLLDWIPQDFVALYFFGYAKQQQNQPRFLYDFYKEPPVFTDAEFEVVVDHIIHKSELRDKRRIVHWFESFGNDLVQQYLNIHKEREDQENNYANVPRDVFVCFSSYNLEIAEQVVKELEADGNTCWISTRNLRTNDTDNYWKNIENAISNSTIFLVISSEDSMRSKDVHQEIDFARLQKKTILEFKIDDKPHNTLFKHVFDGIKWIKGTQQINQSYLDLLQRIYEEKHQLPGTRSESEFHLDSLESNLNTDIAPIQYGDINGIVERDNFSEKQHNSKLYNASSENDSAIDLSNLSHNNSILNREELFSKSRFALLIISIVIVIAIVAVIVNIDNNSSASDISLDNNAPSNVVIPEDNSPSIITSPDIEDPSTNVMGHRTKQISSSNLFNRGSVDIIDSIVLSNGEIASIGFLEDIDGFDSLILSFYNVEQGINISSLIVSVVPTDSIKINREFFQIQQINQDRVMVSHVIKNPDDNIDIKEIVFSIYDFNGAKISSINYEFNDNFWEPARYESLYLNLELLGSLVGLKLHDDKIFILTTTSLGHHIYEIDQTFKVISFQQNLLSNQLKIIRARSSAYRNEISFMGIHFRYSNIEDLSYPFYIQYFSDNKFSRINQLTNSNLYELIEFPEMSQAINLSSIVSSVSTLFGQYYIGSFSELNPTGFGYLPSDYYFGYYGSQGLFEIDLKSMLSDSININIDEYIRVGGMYYDPISTHFVLNLSKIKLDFSSSNNFAAYISPQGELIGVEETNWTLSSTDRTNVFDDGTILSTSQHAILIQSFR